MSCTSSGISMFFSLLNSWSLIPAENNGGGRIVGSLVPGCNNGGNGLGRSGKMLYHDVGISFSLKMILVCFISPPLFLIAKEFDIKLRLSLGLQGPHPCRY